MTKKKKEDHFASEASIPAGVYPELDRDLGRDSTANVVRSANLIGLRPDLMAFPFQMEAGSIFDSDLAWDNLENNVPAADWDLWPDPHDDR